MELFSTTRDRKRKFEVPEGLPVFKDLHGQPVLKWDVGNVGSVLSPYMVDFMNPGDLWKEKMAPADVHHRPVDCDRHELSHPTQIGETPCPYNHSW